MFYSFAVWDYNRDSNGELPEEERIWTDYGSLNTIISTINQLWYNIDYMKIQRKVIDSLGVFSGNEIPIIPIDWNNK